MSVILPVLVNGAVLSSTYVLMALGLTLVFGVMGIVNFAHGSIYMVGMFISVYFLGQLGLNYFVVIVIAALMTAVIGMLIERFLFTPLRQNFNGALLVTLGLIGVIDQSVALIFGAKASGAGVPSPFGRVLHFAGVSLSLDRLVVVAICVVLAAGLLVFIKRAKHGQAMMAAAENAEGASLQGVNIANIRLLCMAIGCALAGAAGAVTAPLSYATPEVGDMVIMKIFILVVFGGLGSIPGAIVGGLIVGFADSIAGTYLNADVAPVIVYGALFVILMIRPTGIWGHE
ncbi:MAG: branched-chain amino acid ABC transporter permease [Dehalococcoidia bacterium]|nr:branched-chain amino acid ABC transporter permease [Dehalococcoidia bacterium]